ncbi:hypothetical protein J6K35_02710, partial [bacterium]|nr:hypothetical protein [bacterium]
ELSAMLPTTIEDDNDADFADSNPWVITKGSRHIKNKQLLENISSQDTNIDITKGLTLGLQDTSEDSYKVAERIKSSLLFPIPSEILNDENLTPTFIKKSKKKEKPATNNLKLIPSTPKESAKEPEPNGLLNSISSWLSSDTNKNKDDNTQKNSAAPSYSSQGASIPAKAPSQLNNNEFVNFYKTLQETSAAQHSNSIIPSELKLSFQPERAEISGQTLRWLKAFSEAAQAEDTYLQIRLDASASTELQRKRLNLLYTIFMNNSVDLKKIDTVFSLTEPNAFIIRTLKVK